MTVTYKLTIHKGDLQKERQVSSLFLGIWGSHTGDPCDGKDVPPGIQGVTIPPWIKRCG